MTRDTCFKKSMMMAVIQLDDGLMEGGSFVVEVHIVQKGDTLWKISRQHGISFEDLKRVNAHLATPDYIVPGMKIFLPDKKQGAGVVKQPTPHSKQPHPEKVEKVIKVEKKEELPVKPKEEVKVPVEPIPIPLPSVPKPSPKPSKPVEKPKPSKPVEPKEERAELPKPPERPIPQPEVQHPPQMIPMQPYPIYGIPCGWFPIYDADCYPHVYPGQMRPMSALPPGQFPEHHHKPSLIQPCNPATRPFEEEPVVPKQERPKPLPISPKLQEPTLPIPPKVPDIEAPMIPLTPPKKAPVQPVIPPTYERPMPPSQPSIPQEHLPYDYPNTYPTHGGQYPPYGGQQFYPMPMPMPMPPQQSMPSHPHPFCNTCNQAIPQHPMFYPMPNYWPGQQ